MYLFFISDDKPENYVPIQLDKNEFNKLVEQKVLPILTIARVGANLNPTLFGFATGSDSGNRGQNRGSADRGADRNVPVKPEFRTGPMKIIGIEKKRDVIDLYDFFKERYK